jgi:hypothetical protein
MVTHMALQGPLGYGSPVTLGHLEWALWLDWARGSCGGLNGILGLWSSALEKVYRCTEFHRLHACVHLYIVSDGPRLPLRRHGHMHACSSISINIFMFTIIVLPLPLSLHPEVPRAPQKCLVRAEPIVFLVD